MLKDKRKPKKPVSDRRAKKGYGRCQPQCVFKLIAEIPKTQKALSVFDNWKHNQKYAEILLIFCETKLPEKLDLLDFSKGDTYSELIYELTKIIVESGYKIAYDNETFRETYVVDFNFNAIKYDWHWYIMEVKALHKIKSQELKIGYVHLMKKFGKQTETSFIDHGFKSFDDSLNQYDTDWLQSEFDDGSIGDEFDDYESYQEHSLKPYLAAKNEFEQLIKEPIQKFIDYKPKNKPERKLKELLEEGHQIDFSIIHKFPDDEFPHTEDGSMVSYSQSFMLIYDWDSEFEQLMMERWNMEANEYGVTLPVNFYRFEKGKIINGPSEDDEKQLNKLCKFLCNLNTYFD